MIATVDFSSSSRRTAAPTDRTDRAAASRAEAQHDTTLVLRFNAGDESAFVEIMTCYHDRMFSVALAMLKNRADAEEVAQDTFIRAHRGLAKFRGDSSLATWLHRIALNLARNRYWYFFRRRRHNSISLDCAFSADNQSTFADLIATNATGPARDAEEGEFVELVSRCMERMEPRTREILTLRNILNRSYGEISRELGLNIGTVKSRLARARQNLKTLLTEACPEFGAEARPLAWFDSTRPSGALEAVCA